MNRFLPSRLVHALVVMLLLVAGAAQAQSEYRLNSGDVLRFEVLEDPALNRSLLVAPDGRISVPLVGNLRVGGQTIDAVRAELTQRLASNFAVAPTVFVALERRPDPRPAQAAAAATIQIFVLGEARSPGRLELRQGTTLLQGIAQMGGFTNFAATKRLQLRRGETVWTINYQQIEAGSSQYANMALQEGDVIIVPQRRLFE